MPPRKEEEEELDRSPTAKRKRRAKLYSFNRALRNNALLKDDLITAEKQLDRDQHRSRKMADHVKAVMNLNTKHVENTSTWMNNHLNKCLLILERGRHLQVVKPYFHAPGKPLTPYHKKRERQEKIEEDQKEKETKPKASGVFVQYNEPKKFSHRRDNCNVIRTNRQFE